MINCLKLKILKSEISCHIYTFLSFKLINVMMSLLYIAENCVFKENALHENKAGLPRLEIVVGKAHIILPSCRKIRKPSLVSVMTSE